MKVLLVDDQKLIRRGLSLLLSTEPDVSAVVEAGHGREALARVDAERPDVVLSDARMPVLDGVGLVREMRTLHPQIPVIVLTTFDDQDLVRQALRAGAAGFLLKDSAPEELIAALRAVLDGGLVVDPRVARIAITAGEDDDDTAGSGADRHLAMLTPTERTVAGHVATGATNAEIAQAMVLAEGTVKNHVSALLRKLDQRDRTALALYLHGLLGGSAQR